MNKNLAFASVIGAALIGSGASAQSTGANQQSGAAAQPAQSQPGAAAAQSPSGGMFVKEQALSQWRAPKLVGVAVYDAADKKIGTIKDLLIDHDGRAQVIVVDVGGFLGFGAKEVGLPFKAIQWRTESRSVPAPGQPPTNPVGVAGGGSNTRPATQQIDPAATEASQGYPDKAIVSVTLAQLKSAPDFQYAPSPLADLESRAPASNEPKQTQTQ